jgi:hypothetical protein
MAKPHQNIDFRFVDGDFWRQIVLNPPVLHFVGECHGPPP